ncbi:hypothetical protein [Actinomycetospora flava]|uniref:Uncharacterized protein n=1 Tax=Actinomycetospora flava TaxID=3129232 RepID=A0ABU8MFX9_9PSEU
MPGTATGSSYTSSAPSARRTARAVAGLLRERAGLPGDDPRVPLCLDVLVLAVNRAGREWAVLPGEPGLDELAPRSAVSSPRCRAR